MKTVLKASLTMALLTSAMATQATECGHITIAALGWQSAQLQAHVDKLILNEGYGCAAENVMGDTVPTMTSMLEKGKPDMVSEVWVDNVPKIFEEGTSSGKLVAITESLSEGGQNTWFIPEYFAKKHPEIKTVADVLEHPELFPSPMNPKRAALFNGAEGWGWTVITAQLFKGFDFEEAGFDLINTGSNAALDSTIMRAAAQEKGWVGYYWAPTPLMGKYPMVALDPGVPFDQEEWERCSTKANCPDPKPNAWPLKSEVYTVITENFSKQVNPKVKDYLKNRSWKNSEMSAMMSWMTENQATGDDAARYFIKTYPEVWSQWVPDDIKNRIENKVR